MDALLALVVLAASEVGFEGPISRGACLDTASAEACEALGYLMKAGALRPRFAEEPGLFFALACERGSGPACAHAEAWAKRYPDYEDLEGDVGCMLKDNGFACEELALGLREEGGAAREGLGEARMKRALALHRQGCAAGKPESCVGASRVLTTGFGVPRDPHAASVHLARGCALGLATACEQQAEQSRGDEAIRLFGRACDLDATSPHACLRLARASEHARLPKLEVDSRYRIACERLSFDACAWWSRKHSSLSAGPPSLVEAFARWCDVGSAEACEKVSALKEVPNTAQAPAVAQDVLTRLGRALFFDTELSRPAGRACASCHDPQAGFSDPDHGKSTSAGAVAGRFGERNAPTAAYVRFSPPFHFEPSDSSYVGGMFWDGRAADLDDQAAGPLLNPAEMNQPDAAAVVEVVRRRPYAPLFREAFGDGALGDAERGMAEVSAAIAAFERNPSLAPFSSKYDAFLRGEATLSPTERRGLLLFEDPKKGNCSSCHPSRPRPDGSPPLFTDFGYDNLGIPANPRIASKQVDLGLGGRLGLPKENGKFKAPTLRNVALTAPYGHNGYFASLKDIVHFYNTRDVERWAPPEVPETMNRKDMGRLGLSARDEADLLAFLNTLTDGYSPSPSGAAETE